MASAHGTPARYSHGRCRCDPCREAAATAARHRYRMIAYGQWQPFTDAAPVREHVRSLQAQGLGWQRIAELAGVAAPTVSSMLYGRAGRPPTGKIRTATAQALLAFRPALDDLPATAPVDAAGTRRRLRALAVNGWSAARLAARLGIDPTHLRRIIRGDGKSRNVAVATARAVRDLYGELWDRPPPEGTHREKVAASRARNHARRQGWAPPLAWDAIDDPDASPAQGWERAAGSRREHGTLAAEALDLIAMGVDPGRAAERLGVSRSTLGTVLSRARRAEAGDETSNAA